MRLLPLTAEEAAQQMKEAWTRDNANKIVAWEAQLEQDRVMQNDQERVAQEAEAEQLAQREKEAEEQRKEAEKKKPNMNTFDPRRCLGNWIEPRPAQTQGRRGQFLQVDQPRRLRIRAAWRGIRNDEDLSWLELMEAKNSMLHFIAKSGVWPAENAEALAAFFVVLDVHPIRVQTNGRKARSCCTKAGSGGSGLTP
ncbi:hypothetical protein EDB84DRAFT_1439065 [Lactarius hengduanensis]|nr:hypothetical protein EDB84DRAFT_1439065 [Lactarius hengduanensis]